MTIPLENRCQYTEEPHYRCVGYIAFEDSDGRKYCTTHMGKLLRDRAIAAGTIKKVRT